LVKKCPYCGRDIPDDALYCPYCGRKLQDPALRAEAEVLKQRIDYYKHLETISSIESAVFFIAGLITLMLGLLTASQILPYGGAAVGEAMRYLTRLSIFLFVAAIIAVIAGGYYHYKVHQLQKQLEELLRSA